MTALLRRTNHLVFAGGWLFWCLFGALVAGAQQPAEQTGVFRFDHPRQRKIVIPFEVVNNLTIIPFFINDSDTLRFVLDSGVSQPIIIGLRDRDSLLVNMAQKVFLAGLGDGAPIEALHARHNTFRLPGATATGKELYIILNDAFDLSKNLGRHIHGLIGYDVFKDFIVRLDYYNMEMTLYPPQPVGRRSAFRPRQAGTAFPLSIERTKPYIQAEIEHQSRRIPVKMLIDSGASHALALYSFTDSALAVPERRLYSFLGRGLSGNIFGHIARTGRLRLGPYSFEAPVATFPEEKAVRLVAEQSGRHGSIGGDILTRCVVTFDYSHQQLFLRPGARYRQAFHYNLAGIEISSPFPGMPIYLISQIREGTPAYQAGIRAGDQLMTVNGLSVSKFGMNDLFEIFHRHAGRRIMLEVQKENRQRIKVSFKAEDPI